MAISSVSTIEAKETFSELINRVSHYKERVILTRRGKEIAAIVPIEDYLLLEQSQNKVDLHEAYESLKESRAQGSLTLEELKSKIGQS